MVHYVYERDLHSVLTHFASSFYYEIVQNTWWWGCCCWCSGNV